MSYNPREGYPRVVPVLTYEDVAAAIGWLSRAFCFREVLRWTDPAGVVVVAGATPANARGSGFG